MRVLDLFSGLGGWSEAFKERGHEVVTVDREAKFKPTILSDVNSLESSDLGKFDIGPIHQESRMKLLDLFCGMGGWSIGFYREGFECVGIDIVDVAYPYELRLQDVHRFKPNGEKFDVVVASPPCTEFSSLTNISVARGQRPPKDPEKGLELVRETQRIIKEADPKFWLIENVRGAVEHFQPLLGKPTCKYGPWQLWGNFPASLIPDGIKKWGTGIATTGLSEGRDKRSWLDRRNRDNPWVSWIRAKIPLPLSLSIARACKDMILGGKPEGSQ